MVRNRAARCPRGTGCRLARRGQRPRRHCRAGHARHGRPPRTGERSLGVRRGLDAPGERSGPRPAARAYRSSPDDGRRRARHTPHVPGPGRKPEGVVTHPGFLVGTSGHNMHVLSMVRALYEADALSAYITGPVNIGRRRSITEVPARRVEARWRWELARLTANRLGALRLEDWLWERG